MEDVNQNFTNWTEEKTSDWEKRIAYVWTQINNLNKEEFKERIEALVNERGARDPIALFEIACLNDSTGRSDIAVPIYHQAIEDGLKGIRRRRAVIQMASSLRNCGEVDKGLVLLENEFGNSSDELDDAVSAFYSLLLAESGQERKALGIALSVLSKHLPRYNVSLAHYAEEFSENINHPGRPSFMK